MNDVCQYLEADRDKMVETLKTIVNMESFSSEKRLTDKLADKLVEIFELETGGKAEIIPNKVYGNHVRAEWGQGERFKPIHSGLTTTGLERMGPAFLT